MAVKNKVVPSKKVKKVAGSLNTNQPKKKPKPKPKSKPRTVAASGNTNKPPKRTRVRKAKA